MTAEAVISCPRCLCQYAVPPDTNGRLGQCESCKSYFIIVMAKPALPGEAVMLIRPVELRYNFFESGCAQLGRNASDLLALAREAVTPRAVCSVVRTMPRYRSDVENFHWRTRECGKALEKALSLATSAEERARVNEIFFYFTDFIPGRGKETLDMLQCAFLGVLAVDYELSTGKQSADIRKHGPLERFAERMGW